MVDTDNDIYYIPEDGGHAPIYNQMEDMVKDQMININSDISKENGK